MTSGLPWPAQTTPGTPAATASTDPTHAPSGPSSTPFPAKPPAPQPPATISRQLHQILARNGGSRAGRADRPRTRPVTVSMYERRPGFPGYRGT